MWLMWHDLEADRIADEQIGLMEWPGEWKVFFIGCYWCYAVASSYRSQLYGDVNDGEVSLNNTRDQTEQKERSQ